MREKTGEEKEMEEDTDSKSTFQRPCVVKCFRILSSFLNMYVANPNIVVQLVFNVVSELLDQIFSIQRTLIFFLNKIRF